MRTPRTIAVAAVTLAAAAALLTGAAQAADWRPRPVPDSLPDFNALVAGVSYDGIRTVVYPSGDTLMAVSSRGRGWSTPVEVTDLTDQPGQLEASVDAFGTITVAWAEDEFSTGDAWAVRFVDGAWQAPRRIVSANGIESVSLVEHSTGTYVSVSFVTDRTANLRDISTLRLTDGPPVVLPGVPSVGNPMSSTMFASGDYVGLAWATDPFGKAMVAFYSPAAGTWGSATQVNSGANPVSGRPITAAGSSEAAPDGTTAVVTWFEDGRDDWYARQVRGNVLSDESATLYIGPDGTDFERTYAAWDPVAHLAYLAAENEEAGAEGILGTILGGGFWVPTQVVHAGAVAGTASLAATGLGGAMSWRDEATDEVMTRTWLRSADSWALGDASFLGAGQPSSMVIPDATPAVVWIDATRRVTLSLDLQAPRLDRARPARRGEVRVRWTAPPQLAPTTYVVQIRPRGGRWVIVDRVPSLRASFPGVPGTTYQVRVAAIAPGTRTVWSNVLTATARR